MSDNAHPISVLPFQSIARAEPLTRQQAEALVDAAMERDGLALAASAHEDAASGGWLFEATCEGAPDLDAFAQLARETLGGEVAFSAEPLDAAIDWVAQSLEGLPAITAGGFYVHGRHVDAPVPEGLTPILIEAAQAFGTGHHETTAGCLEAIDRVLSGRRPRFLLDLGTGTGILAIALAKRLEKHVIASDIDPVAVRTAAANARVNGVGRFIITVEAAGLDHPLIARHAPYELVVANILMGPLIELAQAIGAATAPGANVILSGLLAAQADEVAAAYAREAMALRHKLVRGDWATLMLEKA